ncbi:MULTISPECIES: hypothetical protein [unclassified Streptomyces]|uniref:hypothetical protein n=1 Tax=unclassified Streptomyces TaxID=2593676 RepID=UPI00225045E6|nr:MULTISPECIES: hypothetical protein [unclassified Streptomyces]WSP60138.1 hypothetical protein OG306_22155 [Streptomyces sp. NBC_01241]WSU26467.1 hypothetical protein OG508_17075 [Streptomyces sp. NBC_01108]MCX4788529.1 hypothetical protein [Streptomyces sp. NBC_01221]MCX4795711.1 hypothetical protein [Streptomyces sp. NBC_01242]WSJ41045.1 hypothetical protein OG772_13775 [Streptomyces sp. NBC_01321]
MIRNVLGSFLALLGAAAAVLSPFRQWYDGRLGRHYRVDELFTGITGNRPGPLSSILVVFLFAALLTVVGVVLRSRLLVAAAGVVTLGFTVLWMVRQGEAVGSLTVSGDGSGLRWGAAEATVGAVLMLLGAWVMPGRRGGGRRPARGGHDQPYPVPDSKNPDTWPPTQEPGPSVQTSPLPEPEPDLYTGPPPEDRRPGPEDQDTPPHPVLPDEGPEGRGPRRPPSS